MTSAGRRHVLRPVTATAAALAPFGTLLGGDEAGPGRPMDYYPGTIGRADFVAPDDVQIATVRLAPRPLEVRWMERHWKHTQAFIPLGGRPFVLVMAPPEDAAVPRLDALRAFQFDGRAGFLMKIGTWHEFPFALDGPMDLIVILRGEAVRDLKNVSPGTAEAAGPDLDKKDIAARLGVTVEIAPIEA